MPGHGRRRKPAQAGKRYLAFYRTHSVGGRLPAGAEHDGDIVLVTAGKSSEPCRARRGGIERVGPVKRIVDHHAAIP
jgi:hypothetical protein